MPVLIITYFIIIVLLMSPPWIFFKKRVNWRRWEYGLPLYAIGAWFIANETESINSYTNGIVEVLLVVVVCSLGAWMRVVIPGKTKNSSLASVIFFNLLPIIIAVVLRYHMFDLSD